MKEANDVHGAEQVNFSIESHYGLPYNGVEQLSSQGAPSLPGEMRRYPVGVWLFKTLDCMFTYP